MIKPIEETGKKFRLEWAINELKTRRGRIAIIRLAKYIIDGGNLYKNTPEFVEIAQQYRPDQKKPEATLRRFIKQEIVKDAMARKIVDILDEQNVDENWVAKYIQIGVDMAVKKDDPGKLLDYIKNVQDLRDMNPGKTLASKEKGYIEGPESMFSDFDEKLLDK